MKEPEIRRMVQVGPKESILSAVIDPENPCHILAMIQREDASVYPRTTPGSRGWLPRRADGTICYTAHELESNWSWKSFVFSGSDQALEQH